MLAEVRDSITFINDRLLSEGKRCRVLLWSGRANPRPDAIRAVGELGCVNLNGGTFRWDDANDSVGFVLPWSKRVGDQLQVYCGAANENVFSGFFSTMPNAYWHIDEDPDAHGQGQDPQARKHLRPLLLLRAAGSSPNAAPPDSEVGSRRGDRSDSCIGLVQRRGLDAERMPHRPDRGGLCSPRLWRVPHAALRRTDAAHRLESLAGCRWSATSRCFVVRAPIPSKCRAAFP